MAQGRHELYPLPVPNRSTSIGYSRKDAAKRVLISSDYQLGDDYIIVKNSENLTGQDEVIHKIVVNSVQQGFQGGRPSDKIFLSIDCFKAFCMMARTEQGREVRKYFIEIERAYIEQLERQFKSDKEAIAEVPNWKIPEKLIGTWYSLEKLQKVVNYAHGLSGCLNAVKEQGRYFTDWNFDLRKSSFCLKPTKSYRVEARFFITMVICSRSRVGLDLGALPPELGFVKELVEQLRNEDCKEYNSLKPKR